MKIKCIKCGELIECEDVTEGEMTKDGWICDNCIEWGSLTK